MDHGGRYRMGWISFKLAPGDIHLWRRDEDEEERVMRLGLFGLEGLHSFFFVGFRPGSFGLQ